LGVLYEYGLGVKRNKRKANELYSIAASFGIEEAKKRLRRNHFLSQGDLLKYGQDLLKDYLKDQLEDCISDLVSYAVDKVIDENGSIIGDIVGDITADLITSLFFDN